MTANSDLSPKTQNITKLFLVMHLFCLSSNYAKLYSETFMMIGHMQGPAVVNEMVA